MIYTITFNPALDYIVTVDAFQPGKTNRTTSELLLPGGKGINVATVLNNLNVSCTAIYYAAGFVGEEITRRLSEAGIRTEAISLSEGTSRINLKLRSIEGTEINGKGPDISPAKLEELLGRLDSLDPEDTLVLAGSIPTSLPDTVYTDIMKRLAKKNVQVVVDAEGELLMKTLALHPFLIKPNKPELEAVFEKELAGRESVISCALELQKLGARNVLVSLGGEGAVLAAENGNVYACGVPQGTLVNAVGAGDSMVAGFLAGWQKNRDTEYAFRLGVCAGCASAYSEYLAEKEAVSDMYESMKDQPVLVENRS